MKAMIITNESNNKVMDKPKYIMECLAIEVTRKCNMNCNFCARGHAQDLDISKEIIDKTFDEMEDVFIESLRISGGEPFLAPELMCYTFDTIIEKHIFINNICIFTNGTISPNKNLIASIKNVLEYLRQSNYHQLLELMNNRHSKVYNGTRNSRFDIIISDMGRNTNEEAIANTINSFNSQINDELFSVVSQKDTFSLFNNITLEGNAKKNYKDLINNSEVALSDIRILNNNYHFYKKPFNEKTNPTFLSDAVDNTPTVTKSLSVAANGNVFPGCISSYERVDANPMFNINDCRHDFFERVNKFCWRHPISAKAMNIRNKYAAIEFCRERKIKVKYMKETDYQRVKSISEAVTACEKIAKDIHPMLPTLSFDEIDLIASAILLIELYKSKIADSEIKYFLDWCTNFDEDMIKEMSEEYCQTLILALTQEDKRRQALMKQNNENLN